MGGLRRGSDIRISDLVGEARFGPGSPTGDMVQWCSGAVVQWCNG